MYNRDLEKEMLRLASIFKVLIITPISSII